MGQPGFFDLDKRLDALSDKGDPLEVIDAAVPWESFRIEIEAAVCPNRDVRKSNAGRKAYDAVLKFKMLILASLYNLSDEQLEYQVRDRLSFMRFLGLGIEAPVPDATTIWLFREELAKAKVVRDLFDKFNHHLDTKGFIARGGQMIDASIIAVPKQRNDRDENDVIKAGKTPEGWEEKPAKNQQKDKDARWTKKHGKSYFGYKNHINADAKHKIIRRYCVTTASVHDSREFEGLLDTTNTSRDVFADSAYRSAETEAKLKRQGYRSRIHNRGARGAPLTEHQQKTNRNKSKTRARVEHVFGAQEMAQGGRQVRTIGIERAATKIGLQNLVYNIRRLVSLQRMAPA
jgi:IS5 family transposase